jgi:RimJ/RimL family protein N-acetyltransferase
VPWSIARITRRDNHRIDWRSASLDDDVVALRPWRDDDLVDAFRTDAIRRWFGRGRDGTPPQDPEVPDYAIVVDRHVVGRIWCRWGARPPEVGYFLREDAWGRGIATRSLRLVCGWLLGAGGYGEVVLYTHPANERSQRVAERAGFVRDGTVEDYASFADGTTSAARFRYS